MRFKTTKTFYLIYKDDELSWVDTLIDDIQDGLPMICYTLKEGAVLDLVERNENNDDDYNWYSDGCESNCILLYNDSEMFLFYSLEDILKNDGFKEVI